MIADLAHLDRFRWHGQSRPNKEWQHFVVHGDGARLIVNFSLTRRPDGDAGRVIVLLERGDDWSGVIERLDPDVVDIASSSLDGTFGRSHLRLENGGYLLDLELPGKGVRGRLAVRPRARPFSSGTRPLADGWMAWLFVPRLVADGWLRFGDVRIGLRSATTYHDHNWGSFGWGDDFGWQWGSLTPDDPANPWSLVFMRMTDRAATSSDAAGLYVWRGDSPVASFRDRDVRIATSGLLRSGPRLTLPGVMTLISPGTAADVPERIELHGHHHDDRLRVEFDCEQFARVAVPAEGGSQPLVHLHEISGRVRAQGHIDGEDVELRGTGVVEQLR